MATRKVTLSLDESAWSFAEQAAARAGMSPSAWISKAARREAVRTGVGPIPEPADIAAPAAGAAGEKAAREGAIRGMPSSARTILPSQEYAFHSHHIRARHNTARSWFLAVVSSAARSVT
ncbi:hypothetical protein, partial [Nocardia cyriacigeorgica]|uniref:hypothetical protein n=1 Tax=Nocardia cyriacigeorgica TaxID=135487 RepID=UPI002457F19D